MKQLFILMSILSLSVFANKISVYKDNTFITVYGGDGGNPLAKRLGEAVEAIQKKLVQNSNCHSFKTSFEITKVREYKVPALPYGNNDFEIKIDYSLCQDVDGVKIVHFEIRDGIYPGNDKGKRDVKIKIRRSFEQVPYFINLNY